MSKTWKFVIGVIVAVVIVAAVGAAGFIAGRTRTITAFAERSQATTQVEVRLVDDDEDGVPDRGVAELSGVGFGRSFGRSPGAQATQLEVRLVDDDQDGIPDRGILDLPAGRGFERGFGPGRGFGRGFEPGRGVARFPGSRFGPFIILAGLFRLAILAGVVGGAVILGVVLFRHWRSSPSAPTTPGDTGSPDPETEAGEPPPTEQESIEEEREPDPGEPEVKEPEDDQPDTEESK